MKEKMAKQCVVALLFFLVVGRASGAIQGVVLQGVEKSTDGVWVGHLVNQSHKDVVTVNLTDGDTLTTFNYEAFASGATKDVFLGNSAEQPKFVVDVVVYADHTAEVDNEHAFGFIVRAHQRAALTLQKANEILAKAGSKEEAAKEMEALAATVPVLRHDAAPQVVPALLRSMAEELREGSITPDELTKRNESHIAEHQKEIMRVQGDVR